MDLRKLTDKEIQETRLTLRYNREKLERAVYVSEKLGLADDDALSSKLYWKMLKLMAILLKKRDEEEAKRKEMTITELMRGLE